MRVVRVWSFVYVVVSGSCLVRVCVFGLCVWLVSVSGSFDFVVCLFFFFKKISLSTQRQNENFHFMHELKKKSEIPI